MVMETKHGTTLSTAVKRDVIDFKHNLLQFGRTLVLADIVFNGGNL